MAGRTGDCPETGRGYTQQPGESGFTETEFTCQTANSTGASVVFSRISGFGLDPIKYTDPDGKWPFGFTFDPIGDFFNVLNQLDIGTQLANLFNSALSGNKADQAYVQMLVNETSKEIAVDTLDVTAKVAGVASDVAGKTTLVATATGQAEIAGPAAVISTAAEAIETGSLVAKVSITGNQNDIKIANTSVKRFSISLIIGTIIGGFKGGNSLNSNSINEQVVDFSSKFVPEVYTTVDKQLNE
jgi:hypothetical protein